MDVGPPSTTRNTTPSVGKQRNKLTSAGRQILEDYWTKQPNSNLPPLDDRKELTKKVKANPGCDYWTDNHTSVWFRRRRNKSQLSQNRDLKRELPSEQSNLADVLFNLSVLIRNHPNPGSEVIETWANLLAISNPAVQARAQNVPLDSWITVIQKLIQNQSSALSPMTPPIPSETIPSKTHLENLKSSLPSESVFKMKHEPLVSPVLSPLPISSLDDTSGESSPVDTALQNPQFHTPFIEFIREAFSIQAPLPEFGPPPTNADEFDTMFLSYEKKLSRLLRIMQARS